MDKSDANHSGKEHGFIDNFSKSFITENKYVKSLESYFNIARSKSPKVYCQFLDLWKAEMAELEGFSCYDSKLCLSFYSSIYNKNQDLFVFENSGKVRRYLFNNTKEVSLVDAKKTNRLIELNYNIFLEYNFYVTAKKFVIPENKKEPLTEIIAIALNNVGEVPSFFYK